MTHDILCSLHKVYIEHCLASNKCTRLRLGSNCMYLQHPPKCQVYRDLARLSPPSPTLLVLTWAWLVSMVWSVSPSPVSPPLCVICVSTCQFHLSQVQEFSIDFIIIWLWDQVITIKEKKFGIYICSTASIHSQSRPQLPCNHVCIYPPHCTLD